jgi:hypothetical protein
MIERENFLGCCKKGYSILSGSQKVEKRTWILISKPMNACCMEGRNKY